MKKQFIATVLLFACVFGSGFAKSNKSLTPIEIDYITQTNEGLTYTVLPQFELLGIACRLAGIECYTLNYNGNNDYLSQTDTLFEKYKTHQFINHIKQLNVKGISADGFISLAYHIKPDFSGTTVEIKKNKPETLNLQWKNVSANEINSFVKDLNKFAQDCNFSRFYLLNRGTYIANVGYMKESLEKYKLQEWATDFYTAGTQKTYNINVSMITAGYCFYDFAVNTENVKGNYISIYPSCELLQVSGCINYCNIQDYANSNWNSIKDVFSKYIIAFNKMIYPDQAKEIEKHEYTPDDLVWLINIYVNLDYGALAFKEDDPDYYNSGKEAITMSFADPENTNKVFDLIEYYKSHRDEYPDFISLYPKITETINSLTIPKSN